MYNIWSEHKDADQLCSYCTVNLRFCFHICRSFIFISESARLVQKHFMMKMGYDIASKLNFRVMGS